jgi:hypothetical protein
MLTAIKRLLVYHHWIPDPAIKAAAIAHAQQEEKLQTLRDRAATATHANDQLTEQIDLMRAQDWFPPASHLPKFPLPQPTK